ncbi:unnamed protein product, partial [marine sediment metagenome]
TATDTAQDLYVEGLELDDVKCDVFSTSLMRDGITDCIATLTIPENYMLTGQQDGTLIFWASEAQ